MRECPFQKYKKGKRMKKLLGLSLVASATILTLNASAQDLSEAIKGVDVSGTVVYRYNDSNVDNGSATANNNYKLATNLKSKVNDDVTANTRFVAQSYTMDTSSSSDANVDVTLQEVNFTYTGIANTAVTVGKQAIDTAFTVARDSIDTEAVGTGIVAATTVGPVTVFGAYFNQTNFGVANTGQDDTGLSLSGSKDVVAAGVMASFGGVNLDASYVDLADTFDAYTVGVDASYKVGEVELSPYARYSALDRDDVTTDNALWKVGLGAQMGIFGAAIGYGETDKEGGVVGVDVSSTTGFDEHWNVTLSNNADSDVLYLSANAQLTDTLNLSVNYSDMDKNGGNDEEEIYTQLTYDMSSNLSMFVRFGEYEVEGSADTTAGRVNIEYTF